MSNTVAVLEEFDRRRADLLQFEVKTRELLQDMAAANSLSIHSVQSRTKSRESLRLKCDRPDKNYQTFSDVTDVVAFRVITYFDDDVDKLSAYLDSTFVVDPSKSVDKRKREPHEFGYAALHCICQYSQTRESLPENRNFRGMSWEVQICSILQHAWNEIEHDIGYKANKEVPSDIKRRLHRLAGTLELIDSEFREIRNRARNYRMAVELRLETNDTDLSDVRIDTISLNAFLRQDPVEKEAEEMLADFFGLPIGDDIPPKSIEMILRGLEILGIEALQDLRKFVSDNTHYLPSFIAGSIAQFTAQGIEVNFESVRPPLVLTNLVIFSIALTGEGALATFFEEIGAYGTLLEAAARVQQEQAKKTFNEESS